MESNKFKSASGLIQCFRDNGKAGGWVAGSKRAEWTYGLSEGAFTFFIAKMDENSQTLRPEVASCRESQPLPQCSVRQY